MKTSTHSPPFRISPSAIARYFFHDCERFLRFASASEATREQEGIPEQPFDASPLMKAILASGYAWEETVLGKYLKKRVLIAEGPGELHTRRFEVEKTLEVLASAEPGQFIYQPSLRIPDSFYRQFDLDPKLILISDNHPDLLEVVSTPQGRALRVYDLKRGEALKLTHRVQILLYALELEAILADAGLADLTVDLSQGGVWLGGQPEPLLFDLADIRPHVIGFLQNDLMRILRTSPQQTDWHLYFRCEWCGYFEHCRQQAKELNDISRLAYLTPHGKRFLATEANVRTLDDLQTFLTRKDADDLLSQCASLNGQRPYLQKQVAALQDGEVVVQGAASPALPINENIRVFLTLQHEPLGQEIYLYGCHLGMSDELRNKILPAKLRKLITSDSGSAKPYVLVASDAQSVAKVRRKWIEFLYEVFTAVDTFNRKTPEWKEQVSLQAYVHNELERSLLVRALMSALEEVDIADKVMTLLFHFQVPELVTTDSHPASELPYPLVVLLDALSRLMALPLDHSYSLPESLTALGSNFAYKRNDYFHFPLGHGLRAEAIHAVWYRGKREQLPQIVKQGEMHLYAMAALLRSMRQQAQEQLFAWPPKFSLPSEDEYDDPLLSRLAFFTRYEHLLECLEIRQMRSESRETQILLGTVLELQAGDSATFKVVGNNTMELDDSGFTKYLLVPDSDAGRRAQLEYSDYALRNKPWGGQQHSARAVVEIEQLWQDELGFPTKFRVKYRKSFADHEPRSKTRYLLYPRFADFNSDKVIQFLRESVPGDGVLLTLLRKPELSVKACRLPAEIERSAQANLPKLDLTASQSEAFQAICQRRFVPVWGPPGTGKTHFLAGTILGLAAAHAAQGKSFRVLLTAFTHAAIENLLRKLANLRDKFAFSKSVQLGKAKRWQGHQLANLEVVEEKNSGTWVAQHQIAVIGATVYSCMKNEDPIDFDLVVVDEASQVRVAEAAIPLSMVAKKGRVILAGDHRQLPPIIHGNYPDPEPGQIVVYRSIFEAIGNLEASGTKGPCQLVENFRMNDVLTSFAAKLLYGPRYRCFDQEVAARRPQIVFPKSTPELIRTCLDPAFPLVIVALQGIRASQENEEEAQLVAEIVHCLRQGLRIEGKPCQDDQHFFRDGVFVVSPHRAQNRTIRRELAKLRQWTHEPFVDTVEKMQGQEAEAVIVSYGVSDVEFATMEADFIYGRNRLNVAMTRARSKCVVCLPQPLLDASPSILDVPEAAQGLAFMRELVQNVQATGETHEFALDGGGKVIVHRTQAVLAPEIL